MRRALLPLLLTLALAGGAARAQDDAHTLDAAALERAARAASARVAPSVVEVESLGGLEEEFRAPTSEEEAQERGGVLARGGFKQAFGPSTGLIVHADGLIVTTTSVLAREPRHIIVTLDDGRSFVARVLGRDDSRALVLLKIEAKDLKVAAPTPPAEVLPGRFAVALGRGLGTRAPSLSLGIVSAVGRVGGRAIQSSAAISPANYGGPLCALDGTVLGVLVPLTLDGGMASVDVYDSGIGFAVPLGDVLAVVPRLQKGERLAPGVLGVAPDPSSEGGVVLASVADGSPAAKAGLKTGEVVLKVDGVAVENAWQLKRALARRYAGDEVELEVRRGTQARTVKVKLAAPEAPPPGHGAPAEGDR